MLFLGLYCRFRINWHRLIGIFVSGYKNAGAEYLFYCDFGILFIIFMKGVADER